MFSLLSTVSHLSLVLFGTDEPGKTNALRAAAEEAVTIQITSINEEIHGANKDITIQAKILGVERTTFGLKKSQVIAIQFTDSVQPLPNSDRVQPLEKDGVYPAFLNRNASHYQPAAGPASFRMTPEKPSAKDSQAFATRLGEAMLTVDSFLKVSPTEEKAKELQATVVGLGQAGDTNLYTWIQARLRYESEFLTAYKAERGSNLTTKEAIQFDDRIKFYNRTRVLIDAPK